MGCQTIPDLLSSLSIVDRIRVASFKPSFLCLLALASLALPGASGQQAPGSGARSNQSPTGLAAPGADVKTDGDAPKVSSAADVRQQQALKESADLLKMAMQLKIQLDKTSSETLSINVIRRAAEIERLAHSVRESLRLLAASN